MDWKRVAELLPDALRIVKVAVGGPVGALADLAGSMIGKAIGADDNPDSVAAAIQADPVRAAELIGAQLAHDVNIARLATQQTIALAREDTQRAQAQLDDVSNARQRDVSIIQAAGHNWRADILAYSAIALFALVVAALIFVDVPSGAGRDLLFYALGSLTTIVITVYQYEFGASQSDKTGNQKSLIAELTRRLHG